MSATFLITGATGFVGSRLCADFIERGDSVRAAARSLSQSVPAGAQQVAIQDINGATDWSEALAGVDVVVHCAARVHVMHDSAADPLAEFRRVNTDGTLRLAREAVQRGARRFVFLSSVKVNGELTSGRAPFAPDDPADPRDPYGVSKWEAEQGLQQIGGLEVVVIRPTLVYGPGVSGNFLRLLALVQRGLPLPFGQTHNRRSMIGLSNLSDFVRECALQPQAAGQTFVISDGQDLSTSELLRRLSVALGKSLLLLPVPASLMTAGLHALGRDNIAQRLLGDLQVNITKAQRLLAWQPPVSIDAELAQTAVWYRTHLPTPAQVN